jgi:hypothetical protein
VLARRDPGGPISMSARPYVAIPAALRHRCGLEPGDRILLAAFPGQDALVRWRWTYHVAVAGRQPVRGSRC